MSLRPSLSFFPSNNQQIKIHFCPNKDQFEACSGKFDRKKNEFLSRNKVLTMEVLLALGASTRAERIFCLQRLRRLQLGFAPQ